MLVYLRLAERRIELVADRDLNRHFTPQTWQDMALRLEQSLRYGEFEERLLLSVVDRSTLIVRHFPLALGRVRRNDLPDQPALF